GEQERLDDVPKGLDELLRFTAEMDRVARRQVHLRQLLLDQRRRLRDRQPRLRVGRHRGDALEVLAIDLRGRLTELDPRDLTERDHHRLAVLAAQHRGDGKRLEVLHRDALRRVDLDHDLALLARWVLPARGRLARQERLDGHGDLGDVEADLPRHLAVHFDAELGARIAHRRLHVDDPRDPRDHPGDVVGDALELAHVGPAHLDGERGPGAAYTARVED